MVGYEGGYGEVERVRGVEVVGCFWGFDGVCYWIFALWIEYEASLSQSFFAFPDFFEGRCVIWDCPLTAGLS